MKIKFSVKFKIGWKRYEIDFIYDEEIDNVENIGNELKAGMNLPTDIIDAIKQYITSVTQSVFYISD